MTEPAPSPPARSELLLDSLTFVLFAGFVVLLYLGYVNVYPTVPYSGFAAIPLLGSLGVLFSANWRAERQGRNGGNPSRTN